MSFRAVLAAIDVQDDRLEMGEKFLLVVLGSYAGPDKTLFPSQSTLAKDLSCTDRSIRAYLARLEKFGFIKRTKRRVGNRQTSDLIVLQFEAETVSARWGKQAVEAETNVASGGKRRPFEAEINSDEPIIEPRRELTRAKPLVPVESQAARAKRQQEMANGLRELAGQLGAKG